MGYAALDGKLWNRGDHSDLCNFSRLLSPSLPMTTNAPLYRNTSIWLTLLVLLIWAGVITGVNAGEPKPYPLTTCIVSGDKIDPNVQPTVHKNQQVRFCCKGCIKKFEACPDKFMVRLQGTETGTGNKPKP